MADKFDEANLYTLVDEEGVEQTFEMLDAMEVDGKQYFALVPVYDDPEKQVEDDGELVVLTSEIVDGEEMMASIDDDDEYERIGNLFIDRLNKLFDGEFDEDEDLEDPDEEYFPILGRKPLTKLLAFAIICYRKTSALCEQVQLF